MFLKIDGIPGESTDNNQVQPAAPFEAGGCCVSGCSLALDTSIKD